MLHPLFCTVCKNTSTSIVCYIAEEGVDMKRIGSEEIQEDMSRYKEISGDIRRGYEAS